MDLIPPALIVARYFAKEQAAIDELQTKQETSARELEEFVEANLSSGSGEEGLLSDATNDKGKVTKGAVKDKLKEVGQDAEFADERAALEHCLELIEAESEASKAVKDAQATLDEKVLKHYAKLTESDIKTLVVDDKWFGAIQTTIDGEVQRLTQHSPAASRSWKSATRSLCRNWSARWIRIAARSRRTSKRWGWRGNDAGGSDDLAHAVWWMRCAYPPYTRYTHRSVINIRRADKRSASAVSLMSTKPMQVNEASAGYAATAQTADVPPGYKRTEVGVIPEDWEVKCLGKHVSFLRNGTNSRAELISEGPIKYLHYGDIHTSDIPHILQPLPEYSSS